MKSWVGSLEGGGRGGMGSLGFNLTGSASLSHTPGLCVLWSSLRFLLMGATDPMWLPPRPGPTWPRSLRSSPKSPLTTQVLMLRFLANVCLPQRFRPTKPHPKPSNVSWGELFNVSPLTLLLRGTVGEEFSWEFRGTGCGPESSPLLYLPQWASCGILRAYIVLIHVYTEPLCVS